MSTPDEPTPGEVLAQAAADADGALGGLEALLRTLPDVDLHRADPEGGWTCAQVVSHIHLSGLLWIADLDRLRHARALSMFREELGHDVLGAPPPSSMEAADRIASLRTALRACLPAVDPAVLDHELQVAPFGTMAVATWMPLLIGHLVSHCGQVEAILATRGLLPQGHGA